MGYSKSEEKLKKYGSLVDKFILSNPVFFNFLSLVFSILFIALYGFASIRALSAGSFEGVGLSLLYLLFGAVFALSNFAVAQLINGFYRHFSRREDFMKWVRKLIFIPFSILVFLTVPHAFFGSEPWYMKIIMISQIYLWLIYFCLRRVFLNADDFVKQVLNT